MVGSLLQRLLMEIDCLLVYSTNLDIGHVELIYVLSGDYAQANRHAVRAEETSHVETENERYEDTRRISKPPKCYLSSDSDCGDSKIRS